MQSNNLKLEQAIGWAIFHKKKSHRLYMAVGYSPLYSTYLLNLLMFHDTLTLHHFPVHFQRHHVNPGRDIG